jgi:hypothetical protein
MLIEGAYSRCPFILAGSLPVEPVFKRVAQYPREPFFEGETFYENARGSSEGETVSNFFFWKDKGSLDPGDPESRGQFRLF